MKSVKILALVSIAILSFFIFAADASAGNFNCSTSTSCGPGEIDVLHISDRFNAHVELPSQNNYPRKVCCGAPIVLGNNCAVPADQKGILLWLQDPLVVD